MSDSLVTEREISKCASNGCHGTKHEDSDFCLACIALKAFRPLPARRCDNLTAQPRTLTERLQDATSEGPVTLLVRRLSPQSYVATIGHAFAGLNYTPTWEGTGPTFETALDAAIQLLEQYHSSLKAS